jgi:hypothetical protein
MSKWPIRGGSLIQDFWRDLKAATRKFSRGWGAKSQSQLEKDKRMLLGKIKDFDRVAELRDINASQWQIRYNLEVLK